MFGIRRPCWTTRSRVGGLPSTTSPKRNSGLRSALRYILPQCIGSTYVPSHYIPFQISSSQSRSMVNAAVDWAKSRNLWRVNPIHKEEEIKVVVDDFSSFQNKKGSTQPSVVLWKWRTLHCSNLVSCSTPIPTIQSSEHPGLPGSRWRPLGRRRHDPRENVQATPGGEGRKG